MKITISDIAKKANVSTATVSRVLNNKSDVSDKTRKKIKNIIEKMDYNPSIIARGLSLNKTHTIGLIIPNITNPYFPEIAKGIENKAEKEGYSVVLYNTDNDYEKEMKILRIMQQKQVDGLIVSLTEKTKDYINKLFSKDFPIVQIDRKVIGLKCPSVITDNFFSGYKATKYLIEHGHRRIAHIVGLPDIQNSIDRLNGYKKALKDYNIELNNEYIVQGDQTIESGYKKGKRLIKLKSAPTAIFSANDLMVIGVYKAAKELSINIPSDLSIVGHDNINISSIVNPSITTMNQPKYKMGEKAAELLIEQLNGKNNISNKVYVSKLIERESVARIERKIK
ncbi:MAG: LacI family DNA-binding transcriptional regulator [Bacillota bacterium]